MTVDAPPLVTIATTFREFDGSSNDAIQRLFLARLKAQTYDRWKLAVTVFREKHVSDVLKTYAIPHSIFQGNVSKESRFSLTDVVANGLQETSAVPGSILIWTTCDVLLGRRFLESVVANFKPLVCMTSSPHVIYRSLEDFENNSRPRYFFEGLDTVIIDPALFSSNEGAEALRKYRLTDWGVFEFFLSAQARLRASAMINLWPDVKIAKIENDRTINQETARYLSQSLKRNRSTLNAFALDHGLKLRFPIGFTEVNRFKRKEGHVRHYLWHISSLPKFTWRVLRQQTRRSRDRATHARTSDVRRWRRAPRG